MIPVSQTITGKKGNCFAACAASILELPLESVPVRPDGEETRWLDLWRDFLASFGMGVQWATYGGPAPRGYSILSVEWNGRDHALVCLDGKIVHDPKVRDPSLEAHARRKHWYVFTILDPSQLSKGTI